MITFLQGDWIEQLKGLPDESHQMCVTSPPYWGLRDYGVDGQLGLEKTPEEYVSKLVSGFEEVRRSLVDSGTLWLNLGDSYNGSGKARGGGGAGPSSSKQKTNGGSLLVCGVRRDCAKPKDLIGIPWMVAFALRAAGWYLRCDIVWAKPNPMPESVTDRPTRAHEYIFLLSKNARYYYDADAIKEPGISDSLARLGRARSEDSKNANGAPGQKPHTTMRPRVNKQRGYSRRHDGFNDRWDQMERDEQCSGSRNKRSVWTVPPANYREAHFATFPPNLIRPCILAGSKPGDTILDPFGGSGTSGAVAMELGRKATLIELNPEYLELAKRRCNGTTAGLPL